MQHSEFVIGATFWCSDRQWRCTDIGTRTVVAIRIDSVKVGSTSPDRRLTLSHGDAEAEGWFNGPPYAVAESVFDENHMRGCTLQPDPEAVAFSADKKGGEPPGPEDTLDEGR